MKRQRNNQMETPVKKYQEMSPMEDELAIVESDVSSPEQHELFNVLVGHSPFYHSPCFSPEQMEEEEEPSDSSSPFDSHESIQEEVPLTVSEMKVEESYYEPRLPLREIDTNRKGCNCRHSKCQKMYCECLKLGLVCDPILCSCQDCHNRQQTDSHRKVTHFQEKLTVSVKSCHCKKSKCLKKYCECYSAGLKCNQLCECIECSNHDENEDPAEHQKMTRKLRRPSNRTAIIYQE